MVVDKKAGTSYTKTLDETTLHDIKRASDEAKQYGWKVVLSDKSGYEYVKNLAKVEKADVAKTFEKAAEMTKDYSESISMGFTNALFNSYVLAKYGEVNTDTVARAAMDIKEMEATGNYTDFYSYVEQAKK